MVPLKNPWPKNYKEDEVWKYIACIVHVVLAKKTELGSDSWQNLIGKSLFFKTICRKGMTVVLFMVCLDKWEKRNEVQQLDVCIYIMNKFPTAMKLVSISKFCWRKKLVVNEEKHASGHKVVIVNSAWPRAFKNISMTALPITSMHQNNARMNQIYFDIA